MIKAADFRDDRVKALVGPADARDQFLCALGGRRAPWLRGAEGGRATSGRNQVHAHGRLASPARVAATILDHIIAEARRRGYARLSLETGSSPAFEPALSLYRKYGFTEGAAFGDYEKSPFNQFLHRDL